MAIVRKTLRLPQTHGLTGRRTRTSLEQLYGERYAPAARFANSLSRTPQQPTSVAVEVDSPVGKSLEQIDRFISDSNRFSPVDPSLDPAFSGKTGEVVQGMVLGKLGRKPIQGTVLTAAQAGLAGAPTELIAQSLPEIVLRRAILNPFGFGNTVAGAYAAGSLGEEAGDELRESGYRMTDEEIDESSAAGALAAGSRMGGIGMAGRGLLSMASGGRVMSPRDLAHEAAGQTAAGITATKPSFAPLPKPGEQDYMTGEIAPTGPTYTPGGSVGPTGTPGEAGMSAAPSKGTSIQDDFSGISDDISGGGASGGGGGTVICTELHRQGLMPDDIYRADVAFGESLDDDTINGYHFWAEPVARLMARSRVFTWTIKPVVMAWAKAMAHRKGVVCGNSLFGSFVLKIGVPLCRFIGKSIRKNTQVVGG